MQQRDGTTSATRGERASWPTVRAAPGPAEVTWRIRVRIADRPGTLARLAIRLADLGCNVLGVAVIPVPDGVLDEIIVRPPVGLSSADLVTAISAEGCECSTVAPADVRDLADSATSTLRRRRHSGVLPAGRRLLAAQRAGHRPACPAERDRRDSRLPHDCRAVLAHRGSGDPGGAPSRTGHHHIRGERAVAGEHRHQRRPQRAVTRGRRTIPGRFTPASVAAARVDPAARTDRGRPSARRCGRTRSGRGRAR